MHAAIWDETEVNGATKQLRYTEWRPNSVGRGGTAVLCCHHVGHLEACRLQSLALGVFVNVRFHSTLTEFKPLLCSISKAQCKNAQTHFFELEKKDNFQSFIFSSSFSVVFLHTQI